MAVRHPCRDKRLSLAAAVPGFVLLQAFHKTFSAWRRLHYFSGLLRYCLDFAASPALLCLSLAVERQILSNTYEHRSSCPQDLHSAWPAGMELAPAGARFGTVSEEGM